MLAILSFFAQMQSAVVYRVAYFTPGAPAIHVAIEAASFSPGPQVLVIPRAIPMGYGEQPYDRFITNVVAASATGAPLAVEREEGPRWRLGAAGATLARVEYDVDIRRMEQEIYSAADASKVRAGYLSVLGYSAFGYFEGHEERPIHLFVEMPSDWPVLTTLAPRAPPSRGRAEGKAAGFYALADSQLVAGPDLTVRRLESKVPLFLALYAEGEADAEILGRLAEEAMTALIEYFGEAPFPHYTVQQELLRPLSERHAYGFSMEHLDSATFYLSDDRGITRASPEEALSRTRYNFAHHFAHAWVPKRAFGVGYYPFTWELAPVLDSIWFSEGFAQYAAIEAIADSLPEGEARKYRDTMIEARFGANVKSAPLFIRTMPTVELSRVASTRYSEDFRTGRNVFSRGGLMAAEMDSLIRTRTGGAKTLRDALRGLMIWSRSSRRAFAVEEIPSVFERATGVDTREVMERWLGPQVQAGGRK
jgi:predicted metalloprotease with PDZ domain